MNFEVRAELNRKSTVQESASWRNNVQSKNKCRKQKKSITDNIQVTITNECINWKNLKS